jgi:nucleoside-diphosphate-sugar epimerase
MISLPSVKGFLHTSSGAVCGQNTHDAHIDPYGFLKTLEELEFAKNCADLNRNYLGVRIWSTSGAYIKSGGLLAIESLISQALVDNKISVESSRRTYRTYADANEILVASLIGLLIGRTGLYNSGGFEIEIGDLASIVADLAPDTGHQIIRPEFRLAKEDRFCSEDPSIESVLHEIGLTFSSISCQVSKTMEYLKEVR